ncbi:MAG: LIC12192 family sporadic carbohydrate cluster protein [Xanthobacteraceae bacterium]|jgi:sporadic carbohydrate cluster protein (TIGR04323 family)
MDTNRVGYRGYVTCRPFGGLHIPVPVQALILRDYCARNGFMYKLHSNENIFPSSYLVLEGMINELDQYEGLLATSMFMMPKRAERRRRIYAAILAKSASLHFVLEDVVVRTPADVEPVEEILSIHNLLPATAGIAPGIAGMASID